MVPQADRCLSSWIFRGDQCRASDHAQGENAFEDKIETLRLLQIELTQRRISHDNRTKLIQTY